MPERPGLIAAPPPSTPPNFIAHDLSLVVSLGTNKQIDVAGSPGAFTKEGKKKKRCELVYLC